VLVREGVLNHTGIDVPISRISNVAFEHSLFDRMMGTGSLTVFPSSGEPLVFDDIPQVEKVHALLYQEIQKAGAPH
jgi:uncharacterized membrane protein YdbT with pleckstrin-like domain